MVFLANLLHLYLNLNISFCEKWKLNFKILWIPVNSLVYWNATLGLIKWQLLSCAFLPFLKFGEKYININYTVPEWQHWQYCCFKHRIMLCPPMIGIFLAILIFPLPLPKQKIGTQSPTGQLLEWGLTDSSSSLSKWLRPKNLLGKEIEIQKKT